MSFDEGKKWTVQSFLDDNEGFNPHCKECGAIREVGDSLVVLPKVVGDFEEAGEIPIESDLLRMFFLICPGCGSVALFNAEELLPDIWP
jgi:hypothetical protein